MLTIIQHIKAVLIPYNYHQHFPAMNKLRWFGYIFMPAATNSLQTDNLQ